MATPDDYIGKVFGTFYIQKKLGHGAEAEVYLCVDQKNGRAYALRLNVEDDDLWDDSPLIPPHNSSLETANAKGSWHAKQGYEKSLEERMRELKPSILDKLRNKFSDEPQFKFEVPVVYGVYDNRYLIPLSTPFRLRNTLNTEDILNLSKPEDILYFELWEDTVLLLLQETHKLIEGSKSEEIWLARWEKILGGEILIAALKAYMKAGTLPLQIQNEILRRVSIRSCVDSELAQNIVLRFLGCVTRDRVEPEASIRTLRCPYFRQNISLFEFEQMVQVLNNLKSDEVSGVDESVMYLSTTLAEMAKKPFDIDEYPQEFEKLSEQPNLSEYNLFLQDFAGQNTPIITLDIIDG